jgi:hypothetical protein
LLVDRDGWSKSLYPPVLVVNFPFGVDRRECEREDGDKADAENDLLPSI